jgi:hypothetical protein
MPPKAHAVLIGLTVYTLENSSSIQLFKFPGGLDLPGRGGVVRKFCTDATGGDYRLVVTQCNPKELSKLDTYWRCLESFFRTKENVSMLVHTLILIPV